MTCRSAPVVQHYHCMAMKDLPLHDSTNTATTVIAEILRLHVISTISPSLLLCDGGRPSTEWQYQYYYCDSVNTETACYQHH